MAKPPKAKAPSAKKDVNYAPKMITGLMMILVGFLFSITGVGMIVGVPVFLVGFVITGFFFLQMRRQKKGLSD
jgi:hypothetical protein